MIVILLGPPGVGKGTQGVLLADALEWERVVTGDLLRAARRDESDLGRKAARYMEAGELVPDELVVALVEDRLEEIPDDRGVIFDGFPRNVAQGRALDRVLDEIGRPADRVIVLQAPDEVLVKRVAGRRSCPECGAVYNVHFNPPETEGVCDRCGSEVVHRQDDQPETVQRRLDVYRDQTEPLMRHYEKTDAAVIRVDGDQAVEDVQNDVRAALDGGDAR